ncbi:MAG: neutral zinc metallopeptidase [Thermosynechococcaceae cyanobacterium]
MTFAKGLYQVCQSALVLGTALLLGQPSALSQTLRTKVYFANTDISQFWSRTFQNLGRPWQRPTAYEYQTFARTPCGIAGEFNAIYCLRNRSIYVNVPLLLQADQQSGDFAAITILAHEYGHAVQDQLGLSRMHRYLVQEELQADCFAGVYAKDAQKRGLLDQTDVQEGYLQSFLSGQIHFHPNSHGTRQQRARAFYRGVTSGFRSCLAYSLLR